MFFISFFKARLLRKKLQRFTVAEFKSFLFDIFIGEWQLGMTKVARHTHKKGPRYIIFFFRYRNVKHYKLMSSFF